jgi:hypothetical protein
MKRSALGNDVSDANFYNQELVSRTKAYVTGEGEFVIWNPTTLEISGPSRSRSCQRATGSCPISRSIEARWCAATACTSR